MYEYEQLLIRYMENLKAQMAARPINLGGISGVNGGAGGPPGGFIGYLPQGRIAYDTTEAASASTPVSGLSILTNLNHIRYRLGVLEANTSGISGSGVSSGSMTVQESGVTVASGITVLNFVGSDVTVIGNTATITTSGGATSSGVFDANNLGYIQVVTPTGGVNLYEPTAAGLTSALTQANLVQRSTVYLPNVEVTGDFTVKSTTTLTGRRNSVIYGMVTLENYAELDSVRIYNTTTSSADPVYGIKVVGSYTKIRDSFVYTENAGAGPAYAIYASGVTRGEYRDSSFVTSESTGDAGFMSHNTSADFYSCSFNGSPYAIAHLGNGQVNTNGCFLTGDIQNIYWHQSMDISVSDYCYDFRGGERFRLQHWNTEHVTYLQYGNPAQDIYVTLPDVDGTLIVGNGTTNAIPLWVGQLDQADSIITQSGTGSITITGDAIVTNQFQGPKAGITEEGGFYTVLQAGENLTRGEVVMVSTTADGHVVKNAVNNDTPIGVVYATTTSGNYAKVVTNGTAYVLPETGFTATRGAIMYSSDSQAGRVDQSVGIPTNVADHWREVGHFVENGSGNGAITKAVLHFN